MIEYADDFVSTQLHPNFWDTTLINKNCLEHTQEISAPTWSLKITLHPHDRSGLGSDQTTTERAEIAERETAATPPGESIWYGFSVYIPEDFIVRDSRLVFAQWKQARSGKSPEWALRYRNGRVHFTVETDAEREVYEAPPTPKGVWHRFLVHHKIDPDRTAYCEAFMDNIQFAEFSGKIEYEDEKTYSYFKMGVYRDAVPYVDTLHFAHFRRGATRAFCEL